MDSPDLYYVRQQFTLGAWKTLTSLTPDPNSPDYTQTLLYQARAYIALNEPLKALDILDADDSSLSIRAVRALARYIAKDDAEKALEDLRDLCIEIEEEGVDEKEKGLVKVIAGTAFAREGEVEEALETLGAGTNNDNLDAAALTIQIYLSINRVDLAKRECDRARKWAEDDLLLQQIEASIGLLTGKDSYSNPHSYYVEQLHNPSIASGQLLLSRGVTHLLRGELPEALSDFTQAEKGENGVTADALAGKIAASELSGQRSEIEPLWTRLQQEYPQHLLVTNVSQKITEFDEAAAAFSVPPLAVASTA
ncbi:hypothetical protein M422DRAFT_30050 [Sphaerobolus stellatus SS14]|uniref:Coatomer subunit epsilon n=1 Tax=Sphaerobolus stellatus (strain SS14) TaxID=990650 RepID=A0A0C9W145_SPHS4|nr:hypothetical protein M422DRAFT_30050 [Sphaerobolus stellatus SS14]